MHPMVAVSAALAGIFAVAIVASLVSKQAQTPAVLVAGATGLTGIIQAATAPVSNNNSNVLTSTNMLGSSLGGLLGNQSGYSTL